MKAPYLGSSFRNGSVAKTSQASIGKVLQTSKIDNAKITLGIVQAVHPDEMTCDVTTGKNTMTTVGGSSQVKHSNGILHKHVPILSRCGLDDSTSKQVWGEMELPAINSAVVIIFILGKESFPVIIGTLFPYAHDLFQDGQTPVNSSSKQFTKKILEKNLDVKTYRRIFKSGSTLEVKADGTMILETVSGQYLELDESTGHFSIHDSHGNSMASTNTSVKINENLEILQ
jgi:hypothetical protein